MKKWTVLLMTLAYSIQLAACGTQPGKILENPASGEISSATEHIDTQEISSTTNTNDFELKLYTDRENYTTEDEIHIWATLEYTGSKDSVTIWHGIPYITFSITDGKDFHADGMIQTILTSTELSRGKVYQYDYVKSGGYSEDDPNADYWWNFYQEPDLYLPAGTYTVSVSGAFYLSEQQRPEEKGPSCQLQITVSDAAETQQIEELI